VIPSGPSGPFLKGYAKLGLWAIILWFLVFIVAPFFREQSPSIKKLARYIDESGIDAGAIYYTEVEEVSDADLAVRNTFRFFLPETKEALNP